VANRQYVIPTLPGMGRGLVNHDEQSKGYRAVTLTDQTKPRTKSWVRGGPYDQGQTPKCVAFTGKGILNTTTLSAAVPYAVRSKYDPDVFYRGAQANDEWYGSDYDGTSGLGLCRYLKTNGKIRAYHWAFGLDEALLTLSWVGPLGIGIMWMNDMFDPDADGYLHATGGEAGGHEIEVTGIDVTRKRVTVTNSWGPEWGRNGRAYMSFDTLGKVLAADGDAFVITA
jgi:hypothetical protein